PYCFLSNEITHKRCCMIMKNKKGHINKWIHLPTRYLALKIYTKRDSVPGMYRNLYKLKPLYKRKPAYYHQLAKLAYRQKKWKQSLDHIEIAIHLTNDDSIKDLQLFKADCL